MAEADNSIPPTRPVRKGGRNSAARLPGSADPIEIAMARVAASDDPDPARALLEEHRLMVGAQRGLARHELFRSRFRTVRDACIALLFIALVGLLGIAVVGASRSKAIVVQAFNVPPSLAARGLTGEVVAQRFLDRLADIQRNADTVRAPASFGSAWSGDLKVQIPSTGVSLDDASRLLRRWLGDETYVSGEVIVDGGILKVSTRSGSQPVAEASGSWSELDATLQKVAEVYFGQQQPYLYSIYLSDAGRDAESMAVAVQLARSGPRDERAWGYNAWGIREERLGNFDESERLFLAGRSLAPHVAPLTFNLMINDLINGRDGAAVLKLPMARAAYVNARRRGTLKPDAVSTILLTIDYQDAAFRADYAAAARATEGTLKLPDYNNSLSSAPILLATSLVRQHRPREALALLRANPISPDNRSGFSSLGTLSMNLSTVATEAAVETGDWSAVAIAALAGDRRAIASSAIDRGLRAVSSWPWLARSAAYLGNSQQAERIAAATPLDCYLCLRTRGVVASLAGNYRASNGWFDKAVKHSPQLAFAELEWGRALLQRRDFAGAIAKFEAATVKAPRWADPLKYAGDALALQGKDKEALGRYAGAAERAPRWGALHLAWGAALWRSGDRAEGMKKLRAATAMDMSAAERQRLRRTIVAIGKTA